MDIQHVLDLIGEGKLKEAWHALGELIHKSKDDGGVHTNDDSGNNGGSPPPPKHS